MADTADISPQYKALQTKLNRAQKENARLNSKLLEVEASSGRIEKDMEGIFAIIANTNPAAKEPIQKYLEERKGQKSYDNASVSAQRSLGEIFSGSDDDLDDEKFATARLKLEEARISGDSAKFDEALALVRGTVAATPAAGAEEMVPLAEVQERAAQLAQAEAARVDTSSPNVSGNNQMTWDDLDKLDLRSGGLAALKASVNAATDQLYN